MGLRRNIRRALDWNYRPIFVTGVASSGTTLTSSLLDQHFQNRLCFHESALEAEETSPIRSFHIESFPSLAEYFKAIHFPEGLTVREVRRSVLELYRKNTRYKTPIQSPVVIDKAPNTHLVRIGKLRPAFSNSKILLVFRDPAANIEGLRRKWPKVFGGATVEEVCDFWEAVHREFITGIAPFKDEVFWLEYEELVKAPEIWLDRFGKFFGLERRDEALQYKDRPNVPGRGLRNVQGGKIEIVENSNKAMRDNLTAREIELIQTRLQDIYAELKDKARRQVS